MTPKEILKKAADLLERKEWLQYAMARNKHSVIVPIQDRQACSFCMVGAVLRVAGEDMPHEEEEPYQTEHLALETKEALMILYRLLVDDRVLPPNLAFCIGRLTYQNDLGLGSKERVMETLRNASSTQERLQPKHDT